MPNKDIMEIVSTVRIKIISILKALFLPPLTAVKDYFTSNSNDLWETSLALMLTTCCNLLTGYFMGVYSSNLEIIPALLILIPGAIAMRGNIFGAFGSRLCSYLHLGQIEPYLKRTRFLNQNILSSFSLSFFMSFFLAVLSGICARALDIPYSIVDLVLISSIAGMISGIIMILPTVLTAFLTYRRGWNPDNFEVPLITLCGDIITLPLLFLSASFIPTLSYIIKDVFFIAFLLLAVFFMVFGLITKPYSRRILAGSVPVFVFCGVLSVLSGGILSIKIEGFIQIVGILTLIPAFLEDGGALGGILSANFSSLLHLGVLKPTLLPSKKVVIKFFNMHIVGIVPFSLLGILFYGLNVLLNLPTPSAKSLFLLSLCAGEFLILMVNFLSYFFSIVTYRAKLDPDNVVIPLVTSFMDILGSFSLILFLILLNII
ncbi:MAG: magnesium transporter [Euryarchaeota archaeon]|nr:magnesium transporter [Euryarchaeota archaeon]